MIDLDIQLRAYLTDLLSQQDFLESQNLNLRALLADAQTRRSQNLGYIDYIQSIILRKGVQHLDDNRQSAIDIGEDA